MRIRSSMMAVALALTAAGCAENAEEMPASESDVDGAEAIAEGEEASAESEDGTTESGEGSTGEGSAADGIELPVGTPPPPPPPPPAPVSMAPPPMPSPVTVDQPVAGETPAEIPAFDPDTMTPAEIEAVIEAFPPPAAGSPVSYCPALERNAPVDQCANFTNLVNNAALGVAALGAAETMRMGQAYPVRLIVGKQARQQQIEDVAGSAGAVTSGELKLAPWICGTLQAPEFEVTGDLRQCKERGASSQVSFEWTVVPRIARKLTLSAKAESRAGKDGEMLDQVDSKVITVNVDASGKTKVNNFMADLTETLGGLRNLLLALLGVIGVIGTIIWRVRKIRRNPDADPVAAPNGDDADDTPDDDKGGTPPPAPPLANGP